MNRQTAQAMLMAIRFKHLLGEEETRKLLHKLEFIEDYCSNTDCYEQRKPAPKDTRFPRSRYCTHHAKIAKQNAEFFGRKLPPVVDTESKKE